MLSPRTSRESAAGRLAALWAKQPPRPGSRRGGWQLLPDKRGHEVGASYGYPALDESRSTAADGAGLAIRLLRVDDRSGRPAWIRDTAGVMRPPFLAGFRGAR